MRITYKFPTASGLLSVLVVAGLATTVLGQGGTRTGTGTGGIGIGTGSFGTGTGSFGTGTGGFGTGTGAFGTGTGGLGTGTGFGQGTAFGTGTQGGMATPQQGGFVGRSATNTQNSFSQITAQGASTTGRGTTTGRGATRGNTGLGQQGFGGGAAAQQTRAIRTRLSVAFDVPTTNTATSFNTRLTTRAATPTHSSRLGSYQVSRSGSTAVLTGSVTSESDRQVAARLALLEPGVFQVRNELTVEGTSDSVGSPPSDVEFLPQPTPAPARN
ncbi:MAG: BON domain-containing protein [Planctomycetales bacterium]|nr:BON domain-containing protein [Planctomycetales bacterium]